MMFEADVVNAQIPDRVNCFYIFLKFGVISICFKKW